MSIRERASFSAPAGLALLIAIACGVISCGLTVSFDEYGTRRRSAPPDKSAPLFGVRGTVAGLEGERASLLLKGTSIEVADGPFAFPPTLADGVDFEVTVQSPQKYACAIERSKGKIAGADATGVAVTCVSRDATLEALSASVGPLSPAFDAGTLIYAVKARMKGILAADRSVPTTLTVNATAANPAARVSIGGVILEPGKPSAPLVVKDGPNVLDIAVVAPSGSTLHYTVVVNGEDFDYVKASDTSEREAFGSGVALWGVTLAVASIGVNNGVYVFTRSGSTWSEQAILREPGRSQTSSVALDGDTLATIRAPTSGPPRVTIYARTGATWSQETFDLLNGAYCSLVAVSGATLAASCYESVRIFKRTDGVWAEEGAFGRPAGGWASALAVSGDTLVIGDSSESSGATGIDGNESDTSAPYAGAVYVLGRSGTTWSFRAYVKASDTLSGAHFGTAVALSGDTLVVGAPGVVDGRAPRSGTAYVFRQAGGVWSQEAYLQGASLGGGNRFGASVAVLTDTIAVGAPDDNLGSGAAHLFHRAVSAWTQSPRVSPPGGGRIAYGTSVALASDVLVVGAPNDGSKATGINGDRTDHSLVAAGAVFVH